MPGEPTQPLGLRATVRVMPYFTPSLFEFLTELVMNNRRERFLANKERFALVFDIQGESLKRAPDVSTPSTRTSST